MIPFCDTEYQSVAVGLSTGLFAGVLSVLTGKIVLGIITGIILATGLEIALHEYRQDEQYQKAKRQLSELLNK